MRIAAFIFWSVLGLGTVAAQPAYDLARNWQELSSDERERAERGKEKYQRLPDGERGRFERNREIWQNLSPDKQQDIRRRYKERGRDSDD